MLGLVDDWVRMLMGHVLQWILLQESVLLGVVRGRGQGWMLVKIWQKFMIGYFFRKCAGRKPQFFWFFKLCDSLQTFVLFSHFFLNFNFPGFLSLKSLGGHFEIALHSIKVLVLYG